MNRSAASLVSRTLGVEISTALLSALLMVASAHAAAAGAEFTALTGTMTVPRAGHTATSLLNGQVFLAGGDNLFPSTGTTYNTAELYDPMANTFAALTATMTTARENFAATLLPNGQVLIAGGFNDNSDCLDTAEVYNPVANTFTALTATMTSARCGPTATLLLNGQVLIAGGDNSAELYDPVANTFTALTATMTSGRDGHTATLLPNGQVLLTGGFGSGPALDTAEVYDPVAQTFTPLTATMTTPRTEHTATLLPNGQVLITGGGRGPKSISAVILLDTAEVYDPVAQTFTPLTARMTSARASHKAALLPNGQVLLTGGNESTSGPALNTAELYTSGPAATPTPTATNTPTAAPSACVGDCNGNGEVTVNEIIVLVNIALGSADGSGCPNGIPSGGSVDIALIIRAVNNALSGCGG